MFLERILSFMVEYINHCREDLARIVNAKEEFGIGFCTHFAPACLAGYEDIARENLGSIGDPLSIEFEFSSRVSN